MWIPKYGAFVLHKHQVKVLEVSLEAAGLSFHAEYKTTKPYFSYFQKINTVVYSLLIVAFIFIPFTTASAVLKHIFLCVYNSGVA